LNYWIITLSKEHSDLWKSVKKVFIKFMTPDIFLEKWLEHLNIIVLGQTTS